MNPFRLFRKYCQLLSIERGRQVGLPYAVGHLMTSAAWLVYGNFFGKFGRRPLAWGMYALVLLITVGPVLDTEGWARWLLGAMWFLAYFAALPAVIFLIDARGRRSTH